MVTKMTADAGLSLLLALLLIVAVIEIWRMKI